MQSSVHRQFNFVHYFHLSGSSLSSLMRSCGFASADLRTSRPTVGRREACIACFACFDLGMEGVAAFE